MFRLIYSHYQDDSKNKNKREMETAERDVSDFERLQVNLLRPRSKSSCWVADRFSASQEIPRILCKPKVHYRVYKCQTPVPILGTVTSVLLHTIILYKINMQPRKEIKKI